jgi:hypothetical protein
VNANLNVHVKMLVFPAPEKFNTFNTFDTFDPVGCWPRTRRSASGMTARRQRQEYADS